MYAFEGERGAVKDLITAGLMLGHAQDENPFGHRSSSRLQHQQGHRAIYEAASPDLYYNLLHESGQPEKIRLITLASDDVNRTCRASPRSLLILCVNPSLPVVSVARF
jgi:hypothetical protein